ARGLVMWGVAVVMAVVLAPPVVAADDAAKPAADGKLRYDWKAGQDYMYRVKITVDLGDESLELTGCPRYRVVSVDGDKIRLGFKGTLREHVTTKGGRSSSSMMRPRGPRGPHGMAGRHGPRGPRGPRMGSMFSPLTGVGPGGPFGGNELTVDRQGNVARQDGTSHLPFLLGNLSLLMIESLPPEPQSTWTVANDAGIVIKEGMPRFGPFTETESFVPAKEKTIYTVENKTDQGTVIRKQYEFTAAAASGEKPPFAITGDGKYTFDTEQGVSGKLDFDMTLTVRKGGVSIEIPVKVAYHLLDEAERAKMAEQAAERKKELAAKREKLGMQTGRDTTTRPGTRSLHGAATAKDAGALAADLQSGDLGRMIRALHQLMRSRPEEPNRAVAEALETVLLKNDNTALRVNAAQALQTWGTKESLPALKKAANDSNRLVQMQAKKAIAEIASQE
ncbi:MAG: HEAT repeat domain-containing protein, partial [Pirellulales bacterium]|nr:HEAT repeat domain-containing protein [Pirellulales bacterium]